MKHSCGIAGDENRTAAYRGQNGSLICSAWSDYGARTFTCLGIRKQLTVSRPVYGRLSMPPGRNSLIGLYCQAVFSIHSHYTKTT
ncbi:hypothetical protein ACN38_g4361 [Penicillium nordicum]|uniref:Uncharacterized protein n=1 Tax=Penicillium nordicum TaxID=229535 RepID=A0A0M9WH53_9EURO|nr:hypothetical protein ACN38_g4361 [Penicillium nordicum]